MAPPVQEATELQVPPLPVTVRPALVPVLNNTMPLEAPLAEMLLNVSPPAPMSTLLTRNAMPVVVESTLVADVPTTTVLGCTKMFAASNAFAVVVFSNRAPLNVVEPPK